ncbi:DNA/RNA helicase domain-containing protein [Thioclava kandeliae]|uniref:DNA/RNA helicase domain-containing protein n=1 Tax=Thioclava kandeliae TaxID=3070818 RepID=A0ABV1SHI3_9RHOB
MKKTVHLQSIVQAHTALDETAFNKFLNLSQQNAEAKKIKRREIESLRLLVDAIQAGSNEGNILDYFYFGYEIPQISKEFDLLRFGADYIVNIELKSSTNVEAIFKQLKRNKYYLAALGKPIFNFAYGSDSNQLYQLGSEDSLIETSVSELINVLSEQNIENIGNIDNLFDPTVYLVSPFNTVKKFLNGEYFLTSEQEEIQKNILQLSMNSGKERLVTLQGAAGTGKTLLSYDIIKSLMNAGLKALVVHVGMLNPGHGELIKEGWRIKAIRDLRAEHLKSYDVILFDEAQRFRNGQLEAFEAKIRELKSMCIFSYDAQQTLSTAETRLEVGEKLSSISDANHYKLRGKKIRTNKEIATFIKGLFDQSENAFTTQTDKIDILYFSDANSARAYQTSSNEEHWTTLRLTPSHYNRNEYHNQYSSHTDKTSHEVIGQEFDNITIILDELFDYDSNGLLTYNGRTYYDATKMLFQNITRCRKRIRILIIGNKKLLSRCMTLLRPSCTLLENQRG